MKAITTLFPIMVFHLLFRSHISRNAVRIVAYVFVAFFSNVCWAFLIVSNRQADIKTLIKKG